MRHETARATQKSKCQVLKSIHTKPNVKMDELNKLMSFTDLTGVTV